MDGTFMMEERPVKLAGVSKKGKLKAWDMEGVDGYFLVTDDMQHVGNSIIVGAGDHQAMLTLDMSEDVFWASDLQKLLDDIEARMELEYAD